MDPERVLRRTIDLALDGVDAGHGGPFGALVAREGVVLSEAHNEVIARQDPTAHAEVLAIRRACEAIGSFSLAGCVLFASCEPCPMCLGAIHWARLDAVYYAASRADAAQAGFDDAAFYEELTRPSDERSLPTVEVACDRRREPFDRWRASTLAIRY